MNLSRKIISCVCVMMVLVMALSACTGGGSSSTAPSASAPSAASSQAPSAASSQEPSLPEGQISAEPIKLRIFAPKGADVTPYDQMENLVEYSKRTNVFVEWEQVNFDQQEERFNVVLASGDLPDMFWNLKNAGYLALRSAKAAADLSEYLTPEIAPNFVARTVEFPETVPAFTDADGGVYFLPLMDGLAANDPTILRKDWLEKLNLPMPVTLDDWYNYWVGVRDNDMNGNGDASDEIPLSVVNASSRTNYFRTWVSAFEMNDRFYVDYKNGNKVSFSNTDSRYKDFLTWANMLWNENILDKEFASLDSNAHKTKNAQNIVGSYRGKLNGQLNGYMLTLPKEIEGYDLIATEPVKSAGGMQLHPGSANFVRFDTIGGVVTTSSKYAKEAVQFCDWFYDFSDPDGGAFVNIFGVEGVTFEYNADKSAYSYTDYVTKNPDGLTAQQALQKYTTRCQHPAYVNAIGSFRMWHDSTVESYANIEPFYKDSLPYTLPNLPLSDDDNKRIKNIMADVDTYVDEMVNKFIMGKESLDNFDKYVATVQGMGIQEAIDIYNKAYDVYKNNM